MLPFAPTAAVRQLQQSMPGDAGILPFFGRSFDFLYDPIGAMLAMREQYGDVFWTQSLGIHGVFMISPEANQLVLRNEDNAFSNHLGPYWPSNGRPHRIPAMVAERGHLRHAEY